MNARSMAMALLALCAAWTSAAATQLQGVQVQGLADEVVEVRLRLDRVPSTPRHFAIQDPARVIVDLEATQPAAGVAGRIDGLGRLASLRVLTAGGRTRVVLNLTQNLGYELQTQGKELVLRLGSPPALQAVAGAGSTRPSGRGNRVEKVDFRRGGQGEGRVIIGFSSDAVPVDVREEGGQLVVELPNSELPAALQQRLDVTDFATPVRTVDSYRRDGVTRIVISVAGEVDHLTYQKENTLVVEVKVAAPAPVAAADERRFRGKKLTLNFQDIEVRALLQIIADFTGINIVASDAVTGNITLRLKDVPWDEALDIILKSKGLGMRRAGNIIMVAPGDEIALRDKHELEAQKQREQLAMLVNESIQINYAKAADIAGLLKSEKNSLLSERGSVAIDERTNKILVKDTPDHLEQVHRLVKELDVPIRQVLIESRIVIANDDFSRDVGARFGVSSGNTGSGGTTAASGTLGGTDTVLGNSGTIGTGTLPGLDDRLNVNLPVSNPAGALAISVLNGNTLLDMELTALQTEGRGEVISNPRVITSNQKEAEIEQGVEIPYLQATSSGATSVAFKKAVLSLKVKPQITPDDRIIMDLRVSKDSVGEVFNNVPSINTREVNTQVLVRDGDTVVLGGIYEQTYSEEEDKVPFFGDIPILGALFRQKRKVDDKAELLIFITPKIVREGVPIR